jgi:hypothetical protein
MLIRSAERITSTLPRQELENTLSAQLEQVLQREDLSPGKMADEVRRVSERNGVWPPTDRAVLYRTFFIMGATLKSPEVRAQVRTHILGQLFKGLSEMVKGAPQQAAETLGNIAVAVGRKPREFGKSALELFKPQQLDALAEALDSLLRRATFRRPAAGNGGRAPA